jgi:LysR family hydrogen peroxide-inducible transcriptional activator
MNDLRSLSVRDLEAVVVLGEVLHFGRAAEQLGMAQPSLSALVRRVEAAVGLVLFERTSRRCAVTADGVLAIAVARDILDRVAALSRLRAGHGRLEGRLRLGQIPTLGPYLTPFVLPALREAVTTMQIYFTEAMTSRLLEMLREDRLDAAILTRPVDVDDLVSMPLFDEELLLAVPAGHRLAGRARVRRGDVAPDEMILLEHGHCLRDQSLAALSMSPGEVSPAAHATGIETLRSMVGSGVGCAFVPALARRDEPGELVSYRRMADPVPTRSVIVVVRPNARAVLVGEAIAGALAGLTLPAAGAPSISPAGSRVSVRSGNPRRSG